LLHLVGCLYYLYQWCTVKQISVNEIYLLIKYIKSVLWRTAKCLSYIEEARCLKVKTHIHVIFLHYTQSQINKLTLNETPIPPLLPISPVTLKVIYNNVLPSLSYRSVSLAISQCHSCFRLANAFKHLDAQNWRQRWKQSLTAQQRIRLI